MLKSTIILHVSLHVYTFFISRCRVASCSWCCLLSVSRCRDCSALCRLRSSMKSFVFFSLSSRIRLQHNTIHNTIQHTTTQYNWVQSIVINQLVDFYVCKEIRLYCTCLVQPCFWPLCHSWAVSQSPSTVWPGELLVLEHHCNTNIQCYYHDLGSIPSLTQSVLMSPASPH